MIRDWYSVRRQHKIVTLCDVHRCKGVTCNDIVQALEGIGLKEWGTYMSHIFSQAVLAALEKREKNADITRMYSCDLFGVDEQNDYNKEQKDICAFLNQKLFNVISETDDELKVVIRWEVIKPLKKAM